MRRRRPWFTWVPPFTVVLAILCARNRFLFSAKLYEQGDAAANSILITRAIHVTLLIGNYSRQGFHHPGPAFLYAQAFGQLLFQDALHLVPTAWNAHLLAVYVLNSAFVALGTMVCYGWARQAALGPAALGPAALWPEGIAAAGMAAIIALGIWQPWVLSSDWFPNMYVLPYLVFVLAAASVAAGAAGDLWIMTFAGWLLIHGHAAFLVIVPLIAMASAALAVWRFGWRACLDRFRPAWIAPAVISAVFALPILLELALHWPGYFGDYLSYSHSAKAGGHSPARIVDFLLWYWWPHANAWLAPVLLCGAALAVAWRLAAGGLRRYLLVLLVMNMVSTVALIIYAAAGIDHLDEYYIGYFYWSAPVITVLVIVAGLVSRLPPRLCLVLGMAMAAAACAVLAAVPGVRTASAPGSSENDPALPGAVRALAAAARGRVIVLDIQHDAWPQTAGLLVQAQRTGVPACVNFPRLSFLFTQQEICTPAQVAHGARYALVIRGRPAGARPMLRLGRVTVVALAPPLAARPAVRPLSRSGCGGTPASVTHH